MKTRKSSPLSRFTAQAGFGTAFTGLTSGVYLTGLAILMGAGDVLVSYLSIILNLCGVLILLFSAFLERFTSRKRLTVGLTILSRLATLLIVAIPAVVPKGLQLAVLVPTVVAAFTLQAQTTVVLNQWMLGFVDGARSGRYISLRQTLTLAVTTVVSLVGGWWMDQMKGRQYLGFVVLFTVAAVMGLCEVVLLARTSEGEPYQAAGRGCRLRELVLVPLKDRRFLGFVGYIFTFYLLLYISDSYTMVYLMRYLALPYQTVTALYMIISLPQVLLLGVWGRLSDRRGHRFALTASIWLFAGETFFTGLASTGTWMWCIPIAFSISSVANAGFAVAVFNRRYELMPRENRIVYDNFYTAAVGLAFLLGPMVGGTVKGLLEASPAVLAAVPMGGIRLLYPISAIGILVLQAVHLRREQRDSCTAVAAHRLAGEV